jgi:MinD-like ATPase involved in chromosome partitioning or flagellar assembly
MSNSTETAAKWHELSVDLDGRVSVDGSVQDGEDAFAQALGIFAEEARDNGAEVLVHSLDAATSTGSWFTVDGEGNLNPATAPVAPAPVAVPAPRPTQPLAARPVLPAAPAAAAAAARASSTPSPGAEVPQRRRRTAADFSASRPEPAKGPAEEGWQGALNKLGFRLAAGKDELRRRDWRAAIQRGLAGHRTISLLNIKGGACKTTDSYLFAATIGRVRGGNVVCVDNNENRGTLGDRSIPANHDHTAIDLLANVDRFANPGNAHELQDYIRPQGENKFHVLASQNNAANREVIDGAAFVQLHHVLRSFYHLIVVDTGNASTASTWQAAVELSDELVLVAMAKEDSVKTLAATVDTLVDDGMQEKLARGVLLLTEPPLASKNRRAHLELLERTREHFSDYVRSVVVLPFDPALDNGGPIVYENLSTQSREAWLMAAAEIMAGL